ncbi:SPRY domain-containing protein 4 isoform X1 [Syngnathus scovelli]|uniref:SPRY domain-containing protein 4 isoform X1 n=1 Tax=Syngnathus scovelli TaxID=161590 RepID=UPI00210F5051|nr:SPRY domain-containing protein 4 isoform X1 [Syngnathus scovelli]
MALPGSVARLCCLAGRTVNFFAARQRPKIVLWTAKRLFITSPANTNSKSKFADLQFRLDEKTAHSSLDLFKKDTGVIYRMLGLDPSHTQDNPERFRDWAVVFGDEKITGGRHYWEVTVKRSQEFRVGVAEALMSRDDCVGTSSSSWVFGYAQRKWFAMTNNKIVPVTLVGKADRVGILLDFEAGTLGLVDIEKRKIVHFIRGRFKIPLCPAFGLWDGELLTHSGLTEPEGLEG